MFEIISVNIYARKGLGVFCQTAVFAFLRRELDDNTVKPDPCVTNIITLVVPTCRPSSAAAGARAVVSNLDLISSSVSIHMNQHNQAFLESCHLPRSNILCARKNRV